jgi:3-oxoacyl-[acyl-carrier protein] reductase
VFSRAGVHLTVVSGEMIDETVDEFAAAIVGAADSPNPQGIVYIGGADYLMTAA